MPPDVEAELVAANADYDDQYEPDFDEDRAETTLDLTPGPSTAIFAQEAQSTPAESTADVILGT